MTAPADARVLVVGAKWPPELFIAQLLSGLRGHGTTIAMTAATRPDRQLVDRWVPWPSSEGVSTGTVRSLAHLRPGAARSGRRRDADWRAAARRAAVEATAADTDTIYVPWTAHAVAMPWLFDLGLPVVVSCRGAHVNVAPWHPDRRVGQGLHDVFEAAAIVHCVSDAIRDEAAQWGLEPARARVIHPAVDLSRFPPSPYPDGPTFRLVSIGDVRWRKGLEYALMAVADLKRDGHDLHYDIVGEASDDGATRHTISDLGLEDVVSLWGPQPPAQVAALLRASHALLLPSLTEGLANVALEAMAAARPVVVTDCGGMTEAVTDGEEGFVVPIRDSRAMAAAVARLIESGRGEGMGEAGRRRVVDHHDLSDQVAAFAAMFAAAIEGDRR